ncbi:MAG: molybdopterin molybdotransferase MoeA [Planctomycetes bacterium]|nr:molybdopterin molybdotransferase MoeA [Planctomycetota bacterium]
MTHAHGLSIDDALALIAAKVAALPVEDVALDRALGRVLAEDVASDLDVPGFDRACMDGFALRAADSFGASSYEPVSLAVVGAAAAGHASPPVGPGQAVRISTGARLPAGADAVVPIEHVEVRGERVRLVAAVAPGKHVARRGDEVRQGAPLLDAGRRLRPVDVGLLASVGRAQVRVHRRPRVAVVTTGDELVAPGQPLPEGRTYEANGALLAACARGCGLDPRRAGPVADTREALAAALDACDEDLVLSTGATSAGPDDVLPELVAARGELWLRGVDMRPGHPVAFGRAGARVHALLPGNPVAAWVCFHVLARPALRLLEGEPPAAALAPPLRRPGRLAAKVTSAAGRTDLVRVTIDAQGAVTPLPGGSAALLAASRAQGLLRVPRALEGLEAGAEVWVEVFE